MEPTLIIHTAATWAMVGLIWVVQVVVYPAFREVPESAFAEYERAHQRRMVAVLALFAPLEIITGAIVFLAPGDVPRWLPFIAGAVLAALWAGTGAYFAPLHGRMADRYSRSDIELLIRTNWFRTIGWTARGGLVLVMVAVA